MCDFMTYSRLDYCTTSWGKHGLPASHQFTELRPNSPARVSKTIFFVKRKDTSPCGVYQ